MKNKTNDLSMNQELNDSLREHNIKILLKVFAGKQFSENCYASLRKGKSKDTPAPPRIRVCLYPSPWWRKIKVDYTHSIMRPPPFRINKSEYLFYLLQWWLTPDESCMVNFP